MCQLEKDIEHARTYLRGWFMGFNPPPPQFFRFSLKSEGIEVGKKENK